MVGPGTSRLAPPPQGRDHPLSPSHPSHPRLARASSSSSLYRVNSPQSPRSETPPSTLDPTVRVKARQVDRLHPSAERRHTRTGSTPIRLVDADLLGTRPPRQSSKDDSAADVPIGRSRASTIRSIARVLNGYTENEMEIIGRRYDLMDDDELAGALKEYKSSTPVSEPMGEAGLDIMETPKARRSSETKSFLARTTPEETINSTSSTPPLFPPSPPPNTRRLPSHPLRILSRAIRDLEDKVAQLVLDNEALQAQLAQSPTERTQQNAIHDDISEALGTSLTSPSPLRPTISHPIPDLARPASPTPTTKSVPPPSRSKSPASIHHPESPRPGLSNAPSKPIKGTWTSSLWGWNGKRSSVQSSSLKTEGRRRDSVGSIASHMTKTSTAETRILPEEAILDEVDEEAWRKGDGGSTPSFRSIVNATRILTPDPSSILTSSSIPSNSLIAYLAHALVSTARDEGLITHDASQRRSSKSRPRAASTVSQESQKPRSIDSETPSADVTRGYGDQALAVGRSLLSSVSNATIRGTKVISSMSDDPIKPSLARTTSRPFLSSTVAAHDMEGKVSGTTSPQTEAPPPSVELSSIVPDEARPPTVLLSRQNLGSFFRSSEVGRVRLTTASRFKGTEPPLTDRYGFIYDIQHAKLLKDASDAGAAAPASLNGTIPAAQPEGWLDKRHAAKRDATSPAPGQTPSRGSRTPLTSSTSTGTSTPRSETADGHADRPKSEILNRHRSPSTVAALNPSPAKPSLAKDHLTVSVRGSTSLGATPEDPSSSPQTTSASLAELPSDHTSDPSASRATISSLLDQLTEIHDRQQKERMVEWDAFLAHRAKVRITAVESRKGSAEMTWGSGLVGFDELQGKKGDQEDKKTFARLVRRGIPMVYRNDIWSECSGARDMKVPGEYAEILKAHLGEKSPVQAEIEKDITRTFPGNVFFGGDGPGVPKLRNVLVAFSWHNPAVGYCQGMNMLAATLLLTHTDEEQAYWTLVAMIDRLLPLSFFSPDLEASRVDQLVLDDLVEQYAPKVHDKLVELGIDLASLTFGWFLSLFTDCLPVETLFRIWDLFFVEGHDVLFRVSLAILKLHESIILSTKSVSDLFAIVSGTTSRLWAADKLVALQHGYKGIIKHGDLQARFDKHLAELRGEGGVRD